MPFTFKKLEIPDIILITPAVFSDERGFFTELVKASEFKANGVDKNFLQHNKSYSKKHVLRGLHYQLNPRAQAKLVSVLRGEIFDIALDIRKGSPTFGKSVTAYLSQENKNMLYIPEGFAHGFCALRDDTEVMYYCSEEYDPKLERCIIWNDASVLTHWPIEKPILSDKDSRGNTLPEADNNFVYKDKL
jgi:dTDP-4-dehydrorhamnose 3,5-epimerase